MLNYIIAKAYWAYAMFLYRRGADNETIVGYLDKSHEIDPRADPHFHPEDYAESVE